MWGDRNASIFGKIVLITKRESRQSQDINIEVSLKRGGCLNTKHLMILRSTTSDHPTAQEPSPTIGHQELLRNEAIE